MKNFKLKRLLSLAFIGCLSSLSASTVFAVAGDIISNQATLSYSVATVAQTDINSNTETFTEDLKINFTVTEVGGATTTVTPSETFAYQTFIVTNNGNAPQDFLFAALNKTEFSLGVAPSSVQVFVDSAADNTGGADAFATATDTGIFMDELDIGVSRTVYIVSTIPADALDTEVATMTLVAQVAAGGTAAATSEATIGDNGAPITNDDNNHTSPAGTYSNGNTVVGAGSANNIGNTLDGEDTVFADAASGTLNSAAGADTASNGQHSDDDSYTVSSAALSVVKLATAWWDPINGGNNPKAIPGAYVQYSITITNSSATVSADLTGLTDTLATTLLDPNLILSTASFPVPGVVDGVDIAVAGGVGEGIRVDVTNSTRAITTIYCTGDTDNTDGCTYDDITYAVNQPINVNLSVVLAEDVPNGYTIGELKPTEIVTITFNAIVQ